MRISTFNNSRDDDHSFYALVEVNYYSSTQTINQKPEDIPYILIPKIGVDEAINNKSVDYGIYHEPIC